MSTSQTGTGIVTDMAGLGQLTTPTHLGYTDWQQMTQELVDAFAELTGDHNYIHVDPERAKQSPFGGTIAHGYLSLSLLAPVTQQLLVVSDAGTSVNYGLDKLRFPAPLRVGARWRGGAELTGVSEIKGGAQVQMTASVEVEGSDKPAVVAEGVFRFYA
jgi:acyl dehydratase